MKETGMPGSRGNSKDQGSRGNGITELPGSNVGRRRTSLLVISDLLIQHGPAR
jgi:hypothetical protein